VIIIRIALFTEDKVTVFFFMSDAFSTVFCRMSDKSGLNAPKTASVLREKCSRKLQVVEQKAPAGKSAGAKV